MIAERRSAVRHLVHAVRGHSRLRHRHHLRIAARPGAVVFGVRRAAGRAVHRRHQQRAEDRAGADRGAVVRHRPGLQGRAVGLADRDRGADRRLSGRQGRRRRPAVAADLDGRRQAPGVLQGGGAVDPAVDHRDLPHQYRLRPGRRRGRRIHLVAARARPPDLHRLQPLRPQHGLGRAVHADDHGLRPLLRHRHHRAHQPALEAGEHHAIRFRSEHSHRHITETSDVVAHAHRPRRRA